MTGLDYEKANQSNGSAGQLASWSSHYEAAVSHAIARKKRMAREAAKLRQHNEALAEGKVPSFNRGVESGTLQERERIIELLQALRSKAKDANLSQTANINAIITLIKGEGK
jgi:hypothetical protein